MKNFIMVFVLAFAAAACGTDTVETSSAQPFCSDFGCSQDMVQCGDFGCVCDIEGGEANAQTQCNPMPNCDELVTASRCEMVVDSPKFGLTCLTRESTFIACH